MRLDAGKLAWILRTIGLAWAEPPGSVSVPEITRPSTARIATARTVALLMVGPPCRNRPMRATICLKRVRVKGLSALEPAQRRQQLVADQPHAGERVPERQAAPHRKSTQPNSRH